MQELYIQKYLIQNYILIMIVLGTYFVVSMKSAVDIFIKKRIIINMSLILILSILEFYIKLNGNMILPVVKMVYSSIRILVMPIAITILKPKIKLIYIPAIINAVISCSVIFQDKIIYFTKTKIFESDALIYSFIVTTCIYWIVFLLILDFKLYKNLEVNHLQIFCCIAWLMTATIAEISGLQEGILNVTYAMIFLFYYLVLHVKISQKVVEEKEIKLREQRMSLMLSQIQPHFLYNTLNTITALCRINPKLAEETTVKFSSYLRENMYNLGKNDTQPFSKELEHIKIYIDIEKLRFGDRVRVEYDIKVENFDMPTLTLQPIVENAVKHGVCKKMEGGTIKITTESKDKENIIVISDDGIGFSMEKILSDGKVHIGIQNVKERLKNIINAELEITSFIGLGTVVKIIIPKKGKNKEIERGRRREILSIGR
ncbi:sensor histidine kinase [Fusobacterium sp.]|uniref:sensor histidine kinase n=1 Tax=Fusobacterium sp. TaxID=68766 RepID=UPI002634A544|nr:histidine kinase [Fusobacterium sp.]